jgi:hypothetical protein
VRLLLAVALVLPLYGQYCPPLGPLPPGSSVSSALDDSHCHLSDGTAYDSYALALPGRGQIQIALNSGPSNQILILRDATGASIYSGAAIQGPIEAGSYVLLVDEVSPGQDGPYTVSTSFTAEPGTLCANFPLLGLNQTINGQLGGAGCAAPGGAAYDAYSLNTFGSGTLTVSASSSSFTPALTLRGDDGGAILTGSSSLSYSVSGSSQYTLVISGAGQTSGYQLSTSFQPANGETCLPQQTFSGSASDSAAITSQSCSQAVSGSDNFEYYNYYNLAITAAGSAELLVSSSAFTPELYLLDANGNTLASDSGGGGNGNSDIRLPLQAGNYTLMLFSPSASGGAYTLQFTFQPGPPAPCPPLTQNLNGAAAGSLSASSCRGALGLSDVYSVTLPATGTLTVSMASTDFETQLAIRDSKDNLLVLYSDDDDTGLSNITASLPAGSYTIAAAAVSGTGAYQLTSQFTAQPIPPCSPITSLSVNGGYVNQLGMNSCTGGNGQPVDYYQFTLPADGAIAAIMTSSVIAGRLTLQDSSGRTLRSDENSYSAGDPLIAQYLPAGTYMLAASAAETSAGGFYQINLLSALGPRPPGCAPQAAIAPGGSIAGNLGFTSCQYPGNTFADIYPFTLTDTTDIDLELDSEAFNAYLIVLDSQGNVVDENEYGAGGTNALISDSFDPGTYFIVATAAAGYTSVGPYTLSLTQQSASSDRQSAISRPPIRK